jgi:hypothetical protein
LMRRRSLDRIDGSRVRARLRGCTFWFGFA